MTETLLSTSNILLFGRVVEDLRIQVAAAAAFTVKAATTDDMPLVSDLAGHGPIDGVPLAPNDLVLVPYLDDELQNGFWKVGAASAAWAREPSTGQPAIRAIVEVQNGVVNKSYRRREPSQITQFLFSHLSVRLGANTFLAGQLSGGVFARMYGFSYEGTYYDLPRPPLFLVHGNGEPATLRSRIQGNIRTQANLARAPRSPTVTGVAAADFEFADDLRVWSYDKGDFTIRMDVETGMFEDVLLGMFFGGDGSGVSGAKVSGAKVSGAKLSGARIAGAKVSGAKLWGGRGDASD